VVKIETRTLKYVPKGLYTTKMTIIDILLRVNAEESHGTTPLGLGY